MTVLFLIAELALLCWFVAVGVEAITQRVMHLPSPFHLGEWHHAYLGAGLVILGAVLGRAIGIGAQLVGLVLTADDLYQHIEQTNNGRLTFQSPLHRFYARTLWPIPAVQWITRQLDRWWVVGVVFGLLAIWLFT